VLWPLATSSSSLAASRPRTVASSRSLSTRRIRRSERRSTSRPGIDSRTTGRRTWRMAPWQSRVISATKSSAGTPGPTSGNAVVHELRLRGPPAVDGRPADPAVVAMRSMVVAEYPRSTNRRRVASSTEASIDGSRRDPGGGAAASPNSSPRSLPQSRLVVTVCHNKGSCGAGRGRHSDDQRNHQAVGGPSGGRPAPLHVPAV